jgi:hypothetical protein
LKLGNTLGGGRLDISRLPLQIGPMIVAPWRAAALRVQTLIEKAGN